MPRRGGGGARRAPPARSAPPPRHAAPARRPPPPAPAAGAPAPAPAQGGGMMGGLMGSMASGMATGVGFSMANRAVDAVMGPRQTEVVHRNEDEAPAPAAAQPMPAANNTQAGQVCGFESDQLKMCLDQFSDISQCQGYMDVLKQCQQRRPEL